MRTIMREGKRRVLLGVLGNERRIDMMTSKIGLVNCDEQVYQFANRPPLRKFSARKWLRPNGPELSCGGEKPPQRSSLRGRSDHRR
jgi:hypothetical protein